MRSKAVRTGLVCRRVLTRYRGDGEFLGDTYRGCEHDCVFCVARRSHDYLPGATRAEFGTRLFVKRNAPEVLEREVARKVRAGDRIRLGVVADPYPPAEREERVTRRSLEILAGGPPVRLHLETRSDLVLRDLDLLGAIAARGEVEVGIALATLDPALARWLEPGAPAPGRRTAAVRRLSGAEIACGIDLAPVMPGINDTLGEIAAVADRAVAARAAWFRARALRLPAGAREPTMAFLRRRRPELYRRYLLRYRDTAEPPRDYVARLGAMMDGIRTERRLAGAPPGERAAPSETAQLALPFPGGAGG